MNFDAKVNADVFKCTINLEPESKRLTPSVFNQAHLKCSWQKRKMEMSNISVGSLVWGKMRAKNKIAYLGMIVQSMPDPALRSEGTDQVIVYWLEETTITKLKKTLVFSILDHEKLKQLILDPRGVDSGAKVLRIYYQRSGNEGDISAYATRSTDLGVFKLLKILAEQFSLGDDKVDEITSVADFEKFIKTNYHVLITNMELSGTIPLYILERVTEIQKKSAKCFIKSKEEDPPHAFTLQWEDRSVETTCLGCRVSLKDPNAPVHPHFVGKLCPNCFNRVTENTPPECMNSRSCIICGWFYHSKECLRCMRSYCTVCLTFWEMSPNIVESSCMACSPIPSVNLKAQSSHEYAVLDYTEIVSHPNLESGLRVLSLFDGISTGLVALKELKIKVQAYFASETNENAILISKSNHGEMIQHIGDVTHITSETIKKLLPIHLVMGGSPCSDLSKVNPNRKGLTDSTGTGPLFFEFVRVLNLVNQEGNYNPGGKPRNFFYLYENVASMDKKNRETITRFFEVSPVLIDADNFSAMSRKRLFWGNIPHMTRLEKKLMDEMGIGQDINLQHVLNPNLNRVAQVKKARTITTQKNSLAQSNGDALVLMKGRKSIPSVQESEKLFGLPEHYTDVNDLTPTTRQKLIGQAWSVQVIRKLLAPLCSLVDQSSTPQQQNCDNDPARFPLYEGSMDKPGTSGLSNWASTSHKKKREDDPMSSSFEVGINDHNDFLCPLINEASNSPQQNGGDDPFEETTDCPMSH